MKLSQFDFDLPPHLIAQHPLPERDASRMLVVDRATGRREHRTFRDLPEILGPEHFLTVNTSRVFPARLRARRRGKEEMIEVLLIRELSASVWEALLRPARKARPGCVLEAGHLAFSVEETTETGARILRFHSENPMPAIESLGEPPLPPYIRRRPAREDRERYQTIFARQRGSIAAPTAGLHFTPGVLDRLEKKGVGLCEILLHVGYGTFQPVRCENIENHRMEPEFFQISDASAAYIRKAKSDGRRLIAVGTTATRVLEHLAHGPGFEKAASGACNLFIYPGFEFKALDGLLTNFHLPQSTLFMLTCALAGRELMLDCYREAIAREYRFFSYGDCMLIL